MFERAVDAIVSGDLDTLDSLLREHPELVTTRSAREHRATLLHYVSANGVEQERQRTPPNIVSIARLLLDAGAAVDAFCDAYGRDATTLYLTVTSAHPRLAGVQNELADLLLERGARIHPGIIRDCLANGCPEAAAHLVTRGATLDFEEAAGVGDVATVRRRLDNGAPVSSPDALNMALFYDRRDVVALLLERGLDPGLHIEWMKEGGRSPLHLAAYCGHVEIVRLLLDHGAQVDAVDETHGTTPLDWALQAWQVEGKGPEDRYRAVVTLLESRTHG